MRKIIACLVVLFSIFTISLLNVKASLFIDEIHNYEITVNPNSDGTLDMEVYIRWEVINDKIDGPLTWIKVGIPNKFVSNIKSLTSNIDDIYYYSDGGSYIRLDLDRGYYAGEILDLKYSYTQARMYFLQDDECYYDYNPGWFDDIYVETAIVRWNAEGVIDANCSTIVDGYYIYQ